MWNLSCRTTARAELDKTFRGRAIQTVQTIKPFQTLQTFTLKQLPQQAPQGQGRPLPEQAPQGQGHSNGFLWAFKAAVCQPANPPKPSKHRPQQAPQGQGHFPNRHPRAKATAMAFYGLSKLPFASPQTLQTLQNPPKPPNPPKPSKPSKHPPKPSKPSKHLPQQAPQGQGHFPNRHPRAKATAMAFYGLSKLPFARPQTLQTFQNLPNPPNPPKPSKPSKHRPQQAPQGQGHFPNRHPRTKATAIAFYGLSSTPSKTFQTLQTPSPAGTPGPRPLPQQAPQGQGHSNGFLWAFKAAVCPPANAPNLPKPSKPSKPSKTFQTLQTPSPAGTPGPRPLPEQAPQGQGHTMAAMAFYGLSKLPFASPQTLQNPPNPPNTVPSRHPRAKATSRTGTPGPRPQQWLSMGFQSCRLPARKPSKTLQNPPNPPNTVPSRHPRAKATSRTGTPGPRPQQWLFMGFQSCRLPARKRSKPSKTFQTLQTLQNLPNPPNTVPSRHPRAKATSRTGTPGPRPQQWLSMGFQSCRLPARKPSKTLQTLQTPSPAGTPGPRPFPEQAPQGQGHSNGFLWAFKAAVCQPANAPNPPKPSKASKPSKTFQTLQTPSKTVQTLQTPSPAGTPGPRPLPQQAPQGQGHSNGFLWAFKAAVCPPANAPNLPKPSKPSKTFQTLQTPSPAGTPGPRPLPEQAPQGQGHSNGFLWAFKHTLQNRPNPPNTFPSRHPRAKATSPTGTPGPRPQQWLSMGFQSCRLPARKRSKPAKTFQTLQTLQNLPNPPNTVPSRHPRAKATSRTGTPGPRPQQWLSMGFQSCRLPARKPSKTLQTPSPAGTPDPLPEQAPQGQGHSNGFLWAFKAAVCQPANAPNPPKPSKASKPSKHPPNTKPSKTVQNRPNSKHLPQQAPQGQGHFPNRHPRAKATAMAFYGLSKLPFARPQTLQTFQNLPNPPNPPKPSKPSKHRPQQAPQGQGHFPNRHPRAKATAMAFYGLSKLPYPPNTVPSRHPRAKATSRTGTPGPRPQQWLSMGFQSCRLPARKPSKTLQNRPNPPNTVPSRHPRAKATSRTGTPGPRPQQWLSMGFQSCRLPARKPSKTLQTLQTPSPAGTPGPRPLPEQAPQGQGHSNGFLWAFKAAVCQPANAPNPPKPSKTSKPSKPSKHPPKPSKTVKHLPQQAPQGQGHFPNRHPRAKATAMAFYGLSKLPFARPQTLQTFQNLPNPPNPPKPSKPSKHRPQQAPQGQGHFPNRHPRAKATAMAFYGLSKLPFASPQTLQNPPNLSNTVPSRHPRAKATSRTGTPGPRPQQWLSMGFQSCRLPARKRSKPSKTLQSLQTLQNPPNPPNTLQNRPNPPNTFPSRHPRAKATSPTGTPGPRPQQWLSMGFQSCRLPARKRSKPSKTFPTLQNLPNPPNTVPSRHPRAKATSRTGTPGPRPQQWLSMGFQSCRLPARKPSKTLQTLQTPSPAGTPGPRPLPEQAPQGQGHSNGFLWAFKAAVCQPANSKPSKTLQTLQTPSPAGTPGPRPLPEQAPQGQGHSNGLGTPGPRPQQWLSMGFQSCRLPARKPSKTLQSLQNPPKPSKPSKHPPKPSKPSKHLPQQAPQGQGHFPNRHPRAKATAMAFYRLSKLPFASPQTPQTFQNLQTLQTLQNLPNPPNTVPSRHPRAKATSRTGTPGPRPQQWLSMGFQSCRLPARKPSKTLQTLQTPSPAGHSNGFLWAFKAAVCQPANAPNPPKPSKASKPSKTLQKTLQTLQTPSKTVQTLQTLHLPQQAPQGQGHFPNRHPRAKATAMAFYGLSKLPFARPQTLQTFQNLPNPPNPPKPSKPSKHRPQQAPQGQGYFPNRHPRAKATAMAFYGLSKLPFASPQTLQNPPNPPNTVPSRHPRAKATSRTGTPGPRPQQWLSMGFQSCRLPARKRSKPSKTLQSLQTLQNPPNPPNTLQNRPNPPNTFPSRHPRAKATSPTGTPGPRPQQWLSMGFQSCRLPARKRSKPSKTFQTLQTLQNLPNPPNTVPSRHPRAKATSPTGTLGPRPQQWLSMGFQSCRLPARKPSKTLQTLQTLQNLPNPPNTLPSFQNLPNPPKPSKPSKHRPQQAPQGQGHFPNRHPRAKATAMAFYGLSKLPFASPQTLQTFQAHPPKPSKPSKHLPQQAPQGQGHFPNRHPRDKATAMAFYGLSKLPFARPQTLQTFQNLPNPPNPPKPSKPSKHRPQIHLSIYPSLSLSLSLSVSLSLSLSPQCPPNRGGSAAPGR